MIYKVIYKISIKKDIKKIQILNLYLHLKMIFIQCLIIYKKALKVCPI